MGERCSEIVMVTEETFYIPTYEAGLPERNPLFWRNECFKGALGAHTCIRYDKIKDDRQPKPYKLPWRMSMY